MIQNSQGFPDGMASSVSFNRQRDPGESPCTALRPRTKCRKPREGGVPEGLREAPEGPLFLGKGFLGVKGLTVSGEEAPGQHFSLQEWGELGQESMMATD